MTVAIIKTEQQQPGKLYVAMSHAKTMGDMTNDMPNPRNSAVYWTGCGMSKNRVLHGSTKKQMLTQGQERVNCLKIKKRENWVTMQKHIITTIQQEKAEENKEKN